MIQTQDLHLACYQPTHVDVQVVGSHIVKHEVNDVRRDVYLKFIKRWEDMSKNFEDDLQRSIDLQICKHEKQMKKDRKSHERNLRRLFKYEAKEIKKGNWDFEDSTSSIHTLTASMKSLKEEWAREMVEDLQTCEEEEKERLILLNKARHQRRINLCINHWETRMKGDFQKFKSKTLEEFEIEKNEKEDLETKKLNDKLESKRCDLQPKLGLIQQRRDLLRDKNLILQEQLNALEVKQLSAKCIINKVISSFEHFIMEILKIDHSEAKEMSTKLLKKIKTNEH